MTIVGACVGSFLNVVIYRLPAGESIVHPPSRCPKCGYGLAWYDNIPVLAWFWLRGRCRKCGNPISVQYPLVEAITAILFGGWFFICYSTNLRPDFVDTGFAVTWPVYGVYVVLFAALLAATMIDARHYIIPLSIPWLVIAVAVVALPVAAAMQPRLVEEQTKRWSRVEPTMITHRIKVERVSAAPHTEGASLPMAVGGVVGLALAMAGVSMKLLPRSFDDPQADPPILGTGEADQKAAQSSGRKDESASNEAPEHWLTHPHPRREVLKELLYVLFPVVGAVIGAMVVGPRMAHTPMPEWLGVLGGVLLGLLGGGAVVWGTRIFGTLAFGKEAMGLGDVHLMAAVGAVCGWRVAVVAFFVAPFLGLAYTAVAQGVGRLLKREVHMIPYGPHLAAATIIVCVAHQPLMQWLAQVLGEI
jgi:leader peptidase (prepilin peptidase)/N-methyltransferase